MPATIKRGSDAPNSWNKVHARWEMTLGLGWRAHLRPQPPPSRAGRGAGVGMSARSQSARVARGADASPACQSRPRPAPGPARPARAGGPAGSTWAQLRGGRAPSLCGPPAGGSGQLGVPAGPWARWVAPSLQEGRCVPVGGSRLGGVAVPVWEIGTRDWHPPGELRAGQMPPSEDLGGHLGMAVLSTLDPRLFPLHPEPARAL